MTTNLLNSKIPTQCVILCGGLGERLLPYTKEIPKPMILCNGKPFLWYLLDNISAQGIKKFCLLTGYLSEKIKDYDLVAGPAGTTTFETIMAGAVPFSVPIKNDGRDSINSWNSLGHLAHLSNIEKKNKIILEDMWLLIIKNHQRLLSLLNKNSKQLDGFGPKRLAKKIIFYYSQNHKGIIDKNIIKKNNLIVSKECEVSDIRYFLKARNHKLARAMSSSSHIITWPEHVKWWLKNDIKKYKLIKGNNTLAYHWIKINRDKNGKFITSGWFLSKGVSYDLQVAYEVLKFQYENVKKNYKNSTWIISMYKKNKFIQRLNNKFGFYPAHKKSIIRIQDSFAKIKNETQVMEMKV